MSPSAEELLRVLADPERLAIAGSLAGGPRAASELAEALGMPRRRVQQHLSKLTAAAIVTVAADRRTYRLEPETLRRAAQEAGPSRDPGLALDDSDDSIQVTTGLACCVSDFMTSCITASGSLSRVRSATCREIAATGRSIVSATTRPKVSESSRNTSPMPPRTE